MSIRYLILALTRRCNLHCAYCYSGDSLTGSDMSEAVMQTAIREVASQTRSFHLQLTGGEPSLVPTAIEKAAILARDTGKCQSLGIQTNATCLTPDLLALFKTYAFQVGVSLDGPPTVHQKQRGMVAETLRGLQMLDAAGIAFRVTTVVTQASAAMLDRLVLTLAGLGHARGIALDLLVAKGRAATPNAMAPADAPTLEKGLRKMLAVLTEVNRRRQIPLRLREQDLIVGGGEKKPAFCHACLAQSLAVDPDGRLFPCGQTLGDPAFAAGTIWEPQFPRLGALRECQPVGATCTGCDLEAVCPGDCPSRLHYNQENNAGLVCSMYRTIWDYATNRLLDQSDCEKRCLIT